MAHKLVLAIPSTAVAQNGTFTATLPTGFTAGQMAAYGHKMFSRGLQQLFTQDAGGLSVSFSGATATVTYKGATTIPAGTAIDCEFHIAGSLDDRVLVANKRMYRASVYRLPLGSPAVKASNNISASQTVTFATTPNALLNGALLAGGRVLLDVPRSVVAAWTSTAILTVTGKDEYGVVVVEKSGSGTSFTGKKAFAEITNVAVSADVTGLTVGTGDVLGLPIYLDKAARILGELKDGAWLAANNDKVYLFGQFADISAADSIFFAAPVAGRVTKISIVLHGAITGADSIITAKINTTLMTMSTFTVANAASANGVITTGAPTAANVVAVNDKIEIITDGASSTTAIAGIIVEITPTYVPNGAFVAGDQTVATATTGDVRGTYAPTLANDGSAYELLVDLPDPIYFGSNQFSG